MNELHFNEICTFNNVTEIQSVATAVPMPA